MQRRSQPRGSTSRAPTDAISPSLHPVQDHLSLWRQHSTIVFASSCPEVQAKSADSAGQSSILHRRSRNILLLLPPQCYDSPLLHFPSVLTKNIKTVEFNDWSIGHKTEFPTKDLAAFSSLSCVRLPMSVIHCWHLSRKCTDEELLQQSGNTEKGDYVVWSRDIVDALPDKNITVGLVMELVLEDIHMVGSRLEIDASSTTNLFARYAMSR